MLKVQDMDVFLRLMRELQKIDPEFPIQYAICLAEVSANEGLSLTQLSEKTGLALSTVSRIIGALSKYRQKGTPFNLVKVKLSAVERRRKEIYLTPKGRAALDTLGGILSGTI